MGLAHNLIHTKCAEVGTLVGKAAGCLKKRRIVAAAVFLLKAKIPLRIKALSQCGSGCAQSYPHQVCRSSGAGPHRARPRAAPDPAFILRIGKIAF